MLSEKPQAELEIIARGGRMADVGKTVASRLVEVPGIVN